MAYTHVQFIGYVLNTAPRINSDGSRTYLGLQDPLMDIEARCGLMLRAMRTARDALAPGPASEPAGRTLKVFMAPEFFLRGATGAYGMDDVQVAVAALRSLGSEEQWTDWMFVFGTIVGMSVPALPVAPYDKDPLALKEIYNFSLVQQGGVACPDDGAVRVVMKELMSGVDFIAGNAGPGQLLLGEVDHLPTAVGGGVGREQQRVNYDGAGIFELAGIHWGLEICLDHHDQVQRLQQSPQLPGQKLVQIQLVPSCGMHLRPQSVIAQPGGYVFNCDGGGWDSHCTLAKWGPHLQELPCSSTTPVDGSPIALPMPSPVQAVDIDSLYASGPGAIHLYPVHKILSQQVKEGEIIDLVWNAADDYQFVFHLVYDHNEEFSTILCSIRSRKIDFHGNRYFLPLSLRTQDAAHNEVSIQMYLVQAPGPYFQGLWCRIAAPEFRFEGIALMCASRYGGLPPYSVW